MQEKNIDYKQYFQNKKITVMGLGLLGRGLGLTKFLAECGADLIVTDLKTKEQLATSVKALEKFQKIKFVLGEHRLEDFRNRDMIIKSAGVPLDSIYINEARKNNIPIEMDVSLFAKCAPEVTVIGVTGTRGKSMTTTLIYEILKNNEKALKRNVFVGGNLRGVATLPLLKKVKDGSILVCELDSWQLQGFGDAGISPHISVFTSFMPDHMNYYKNSMHDYFADKANIFKYQNKSDFLIIRPDMKKFIKKTDTKSKLIVINKKDVLNWKFNVPGEHHKENLTCAVAVAKNLGISENKIKKAVANFKDLEGRLQLLKTYKGIKIYNDNNATTPEATIAGIEALKSTKKNIILICGGADKKLDLTNFVKVVNKNCKSIVLIPGTGTDVLLKNYKLKITNQIGIDFKDVIKKALASAKKGDIILFSPAFTSFGMFNNEYERNDLFMKIVKGLK
ncbi:MAG: UDP-N-acetylmuramoyl-L-alanine--D-glutamate ligase [Candidatus Nomurabacteria bacterium]|nr:UDP-N-acetylmuramoyl-L-alanine--D-glutamate ligase [Candidatus Nomurabacteria bacterium]